MKIIFLLTALLSINILLFTVNTRSNKHNERPPPIKDISKQLRLKEDLPSYIFEYDLERLYPSTYEFYKRLGIIHRDAIYAYYLYHPNIKKVRHKIIQLSIGKTKSKTTPAPFSLNQALIALKRTKTEEQVEQQTEKIIDPIGLRTISIN